MASVAHITGRQLKPTLISFLLPLTLVSLIGNTISFLHPIFNSNTRWIIFSSLFLFVILKIKLLKYIDVSLLVTLIFYIGWCVFTIFWSDVPALTSFKSILLLIIAFTMICAGIEWVKMHCWEAAINYLFIISWITLVSGFFGLNNYYINSDMITNDVILYHGLIRGANMFGVLLAICLPFLLWNTYLSKSKKYKRFFYAGLVIVNLCFLGLSVSRSSMLVVICTFFGFIISLKLRKKMTIAMVMILIIFASFLVDPSILSGFENKYIYKASPNLFHSRSEVWQSSLEGAEAGGLIGLGYGVSHGFADFNFEYGLSAAFYGREKGNSQLAIIEETGIIGFIFYLILIITIFLKLFLLYFKVIDPNQKVLVGIIIGTYTGMLTQSVFEGWWDAPSSPEAIFIWLLIGVIRGLEIVMNNNRGNYYAQSILEAQAGEYLAKERS